MFSKVFSLLFEYLKKIYIYIYIFLVFCKYQWPIERGKKSIDLKINARKLKEDHKFNQCMPIIANHQKYHIVHDIGSRFSRVLRVLYHIEFSKS